MRFVAAVCVLTSCVDGLNTHNGPLVVWHYDRMQYIASFRGNDRKVLKNAQASRTGLPDVTIVPLYNERRTISASYIQVYVGALKKNYTAPMVAIKARKP